MKKMMARVVRVGGKGTSRRVEEKKDENWAGESYKKLQAKKREAAKDVYISMGKGTRKVKYGDIAKTAGRPSGKGRYVTTGKGTGKRKIE